MKRLTVASAAAICMETLLLLSGTSCNSGIETKLTPAATATQLAPDEEQEKMNRLQKTLVEYYTKPAGQAHYTPDVYGDLLLTRYYIYDPLTSAKGVIAIVEGTITGFGRKTEDKDYLYLEVRPLILEQTPAHIAFVEQTLTKPNIDYEDAPHAQGILVNRQPGDFTPAGLVGKLPSMMPAPLQNPFTVAKTAFQTLDPNRDYYVGYNLITGQQLYIADPAVQLSPAFRELTFYAEGRGQFTLPVAGAAVLEQVILDTQAPQNQTLLSQLIRDYGMAPNQQTF